jgi:uncharacterized LabA/DUF88 family protein
MSFDSATCPWKQLERVMFFIDGGYLRKLCRDYGGHDRIDFTKLANVLQRMYSTIPRYPFRLNLIRIYYYDAIVDAKEPEYGSQREYFESLFGLMWYTVRLGELVKSSKEEPRQKGVDILMAVDALTKAYQNHYDTGMFLMGDRDFIPLIEAVKNAGKKTICVFCDSHCSKELVRTFDMNIAFKAEHVKDWLRP